MEKFKGSLASDRDTEPTSDEKNEENRENEYQKLKIIADKIGIRTDISNLKEILMDHFTDEVWQRLMKDPSSVDDEHFK